MRHPVLTALFLCLVATATASAAPPFVKWRHAITPAVYGGVTLADVDGDGKELRRWEARPAEGALTLRLDTPGASAHVLRPPQRARGGLPRTARTRRQRTGWFSCKIAG